MSNFKFQLNRAGVAELMKSSAMQEVLNEKASTIRSRCGDGYEQDSYVGQNRANAMVTASSFKAKRDNLKNNTLLKAVSK
ncbi:hypothetical protein CAC02_09195 [Streptococcus gallolyticus]|uniref:Phage protein n=1 Tax=Streptococcus gallolyticus TaxID=315405 RepID=A0A368UBD8_9STRE|nr:hypothetical protein [Streptococcus gallolyticus]RCW16312.1 hypothetical protein CAC02_09195 [Streptococcus gallolyticus]